MRAIQRVFYAASGFGDVISAHHSWKRHEHESTEVSITFSGQFEDFCQDIGANAYITSPHTRREILTDGPFTLEHRPKPWPNARGIRFHIAEVYYGLGLLATALRFRADVAVLDSGCTHYFVMALFRLFGIPVVPVLHNTLWPSGFPPTKPVHRFILWLDSVFFRFVPKAIIGVSPECERQVEQVTGPRHPPIFQIRAQFQPDYFEQIPPHPPHGLRPFQILYIGRIDRTKGLFDLLEIAQKVEARLPGTVRWEVCGTGKDFETLKRCRQEMALENIVNLRGWTSLEDLVGVYARSHASIVPTRSAFTEGLPMTAAEAILAGRPVITNPVAPALDVLRPAAVEAKTNDVDSYVEGIVRLVTDPDYYNQLCGACPGLQKQFYDRNNGLAAVLKRAILSC